jgi:hypothetical protein
MRCPQCSNKVLQKSDAGTKVRIKGPIVVSDGVFKSQCFWCNTAIQVPVTALETVTSSVAERFVLTK